ncbi:membrane protein [Bacillus sp. OxB-1]|uniref:PH domain-containing protein n=1 Tax=Bacillus sp. (strain OxB-1) TaxID=98228 RepID=UPI0005822977|nr:membrane protein [Bacillus sp. OxB-1]
MMSENRYKLHWVAAVIEALKMMKEMIFPFLFLIVANGWRVPSGGKWYEYWSFILFGLIVLLLLISGIIKWKRFVYWFEESELRIESGLFVKKKRYIPFDRIQSLDYTEGLFHRPFQLVKVKVETAGSSSLTKAEAELTAITKEAANRIEQEMAQAKQKKRFPSAQPDENSMEIENMPEVPIAEAPVSRKVYAMTTDELLLLATTSGGIGVILSGVAIFLSQFSDLIPFEWMFEEVSAFIKFGYLIVAVALFIGFLLVWVLSVFVTLLSHYGFTVALEGGDLVITRGLLEKKRITVPLKRVQSVSIIENPLRQAFGYATVAIHSAGGAAEGSKITLFPLIKKKAIWEPLHDIFPELDIREPTHTLPLRGRPFYYRIDFFWMLPVIGVITYYFFPYGLISLAIIPIIIALGIWQHRSAAYSLHGNQLTMRFRGVSLQTAFVMRKRIQSMDMRQSYFHKRKQVATIVATAKSGISTHKIHVHHMEQEEAERILSWYEKKNPPES